ncbi:hypothetical protein VTN00DRAFT_5206 [Thermoascus crustaceus]|uniref:uncharacterized protein n=1 Tax=Thermoascus crustaceus TaxID=5088 RepID=UPI00374488E8
MYERRRDTAVEIHRKLRSGIHRQLDRTSKTRDKIRERQGPELRRQAPAGQGRSTATTTTTTTVETQLGPRVQVYSWTENSS